MKYIFIIGLLFLSINSQSQTIFGEYCNEENAFTAQLMINKDSTFSYFDFITFRTIEGGFIEINNDTLMLISNGMCFDCLDVVFREHPDTTKFFFSFDPELKKKFPDLKVSFAFKFEKQYDMDNENNLVILQDLGLYRNVPFTTFAINICSRNFNSFIDLLLKYRIKIRNFNEIVIRDNLISVTLKPDYEKLVQKRSISGKYLITQSGDLINVGEEGIIKLKKKED